MDAKPGPTTSYKTRRSRHNVSRACGACRKTKRKCDGNIPCSSCGEKNRKCIFDELQDNRRGRKRTLDELYSKVEAFDAILESLRTSDDESVADLLHLIRKEAPAENIVHQARTIVASHGHGRNGSVKDIRTSRHVMSIASLINVPPLRVPAQPWTTIVGDDAVSHLLSVYFTWHHSAYPSVDQETFVRAMKSKDLSTPFCSPLLVNSVLMMASVYTDHPSAFADPDNPTTRALHFAEEATRLWGLEEGKPTLTNVQALPSLLLANAVLGKDRISLLYVSQMVSLGVEFVKKVESSLKQGKGAYASKEFQTSYHHAVWASFTCQVDIALAWVKPVDTSIPRVKHPYIGLDLETSVPWWPYPQAGPQTTVAQHGVFKESFILHEIGARVVPVLLSVSPRDSPLPGHIVLESTEKLARLAELEQELQDWYSHLPSYAQIRVSTSTPAASLVNLHLCYYIFQIIVQNITIREIRPSGATTEDSRPGLTERKTHAQQNLLAACSGMASLYQWLQDTISLHYFPWHAVQGATLGAYSLLDFLSSSKCPRIPSMFHTMIVVLSAACLRWTIARGIVRAVWITLQEKNLKSHLTEPTLKLLTLGAVDTWRPEDHRLFESCTYPNYKMIEEHGRELADMGQLLGNWSQLKVDGETRHQKPAEGDNGRDVATQ